MPITHAGLAVYALGVRQGQARTLLRGMISRACRVWVSPSQYAAMNLLLAVEQAGVQIGAANWPGVAQDTACRIQYLVSRVNEEAVTLAEEAQSKLNQLISYTERVFEQTRAELLPFLRLGAAITNGGEEGYLTYPKRNGVAAPDEDGWQWADRDRVDELARQVKLTVNELFPSLGDDAKNVDDDLIPYDFWSWHRVEAGLKNLRSRVVTPTKNPPQRKNAERDAQLLGMYEATGTPTYHSPATIRRIWNERHPTATIRSNTVVQKAVENEKRRRNGG